VSDLPDGWVQVPVGEVAEVQGGIQKQPKRKPIKNTYSFLRVANVLRGELNLDEVHMIELFPGELERYRLEVGDLLVVEGNGSPSQIGRSALWRGAIPNSVHQNHLIRVRPQRGVLLPEYLDYFWNSATTADLLRSVASSTSGLYVLTTVKVKSVPVPIPPLAQQRWIVDALEEQFSRFDDAEASLRQAKQRASALRAEALARTAQRNGWPQVTLGEIAVLAGGVTKDAKRQSDPAFVEVPYLRVANVQRGYLDLREVSTIRVSPEKAAALELRPGDILLNEGGDRDKLGRGWVWDGQVDRCIHQNHVFRARLRNAEFDPKFVSLHANASADWFGAHGKQTTNLASISMTTLKTLPIPALPLAEQRRIVSAIEGEVSVLDALAAAIEQASRRSGQLRRAILQRAFTGRLVTQDPNDEPASVLLERIRAERAAAATPPKRSRKRASAAPS
jgi:type I restriction enzyme, S subunit